jgi:hypothetical protein
MAGGDMFGVVVEVDQWWVGHMFGVVVEDPRWWVMHSAAR